jgi:hypothetical protein
MKSLGLHGHENVLRLFDVIEDGKYIYLMLEYAKGGELKQLMTLHKRFDEGVARHFLKQFAEGLKFLDTKGVVHRDLKPQNLLLSARELDATLKIADFGFARTLDSSRHMMNSVLGSPLYMSPELLAEQPYTKKSEMWSVGVIFYEMLYGATPWPDVRTPQMLAAAHKLPISYPAAPPLSAACALLLRRLLQRDPLLRFSPAEFFASRFLNGFVTVQVRHVTSLRRATHCPSTDVDVPGDDACLVDDVAQLLAAKLSLPLEHMLLIAGPPQRKLAGSVDDPMEWIDLDDEVAVACDVSAAIAGAAALDDAARRTAPVSELRPSHTLASYGVVGSKRPLYVFDRRELREAAADKDGFLFVPLPLSELTEADALPASDDVPAGSVDAQLAPLLAFQKKFEANFRQEQKVKRVCDFTYGQCRIVIGQLHVHLRAPAVLANTVLDGVAAAEQSHARARADFEHGRAAAEAAARAAQAELDTLRAVLLPAALAAPQRRALADVLAVDAAQSQASELQRVNEQLARHFGTLAAAVDEVRRVAKRIAEDRGAVDVHTLSQQLREARKWCSHVHTYYQVFQRHYETVGQRVERERRRVADEDAMGWSLVSDGYQEMHNIHQDELDTSKQYLDRLNRFQEELVRSVGAIAARVHPWMHALASHSEALRDLDTPALVSVLLERRAHLTAALAGSLLALRPTYVACLAEARRRQRFVAQLDAVVNAARRAVDDAVQAEEVQRRAFASLHGAALAQPAITVLFPGIAASVAPVTIDASAELNASAASSAWRSLSTAELARARRAAAPDADELDDDDDGFERIEPVFGEQDGGRRLVQLEADNARLRKALAQLLEAKPAPVVAAVAAPPAPAVAVAAPPPTVDDSDSESASSSSSSPSLPLSVSRQIAADANECAALRERLARLWLAPAAASSNELSALSNELKQLHARHVDAVTATAAFVAQLAGQHDAGKELHAIAAATSDDIAALLMQLESFQ